MFLRFYLFHDNLLIHSMLIDSDELDEQFFFFCWNLTEASKERLVFILYYLQQLNVIISFNCWLFA